MPLSNYTKFHLVNNIGKPTLTERVEVSLAMYLNWALLEIGSFTNVDHSSQNIYGSNRSLLRPFGTTYKIYESAKKDWVYETGLDYSVTPYTPQIKVNGTTVSSGFVIDYKLGRVTFTTALASTDVVTARFAYKNVQIVNSGEAPWWKEIQFNPLRTDSISFDKQNDGAYLVNSKYKVQTPLILIETIPERDNSPYEIGNVSQLVNFPVFLHVISENKIFRDKLIDILSPQNGQYFINLNIDSISSNDKWPITYQGALNVSGSMYPDLVTNYEYNKSFILKSKNSDLDLPNPSLYAGTVRWELEILLGTG